MPDFSTDALQLAAPVNPAGAAVAVVELPFNADITDITATTTAAIAAQVLALDILRSTAGGAPASGTSIFAAALATVANAPRDPQYAAGGGGQTQPGSGVGVADTTIYLEFAGNAAPDIQVGALLLIDTEIVSVSGQVTGSARVDNAQPVYAVPVTRGATGAAGATTAATHANGASVFAVKPFIAIGGFRSSLTVNPALLQSAAELNEGDVLALSITGTPPTAGPTVSVSVEVTER